MIDVGGESSRPGAEPVPVDVELARVVPVVEALAAAGRATGRRVRVSVDTVKPEVATAALAAGASLVNDISASLWEVAAAAGAGWVAMHMQGRPRTMQDDPQYDDVVERGRGPSCSSAPGWPWRPGWARSGSTPASGSARRPPTTCRCCGTSAEPGGGRGRRRLRRGRRSGRAASASSALLAAGPGAAEPAPVADRGEGSLATEAAALVAGVGMVRVHDVAATVQMTRLYGPAA